MGDIRRTTDALKQDMEMVKNNLQTDTAAKLEDQIQRMSNLLKSLNAHFRGADSRGARMNFPNTQNEATTGVNAALTMLNTLIEKPESLNPIVKMLGDMVNALETLNNHPETARGG